ncbi:MAG: carboxypeptidase-like regulatory domain-containing protein [Gemmatimonas sp.]
MRFLKARLLAFALASSAAVAAGPVHAQRSGIVGTVSDTLGVALAGVMVELSGTDFGAMTNSEGEFRIVKLKPGPYTISMRRVGFNALSMPITVKDGNPMEIDFELSPTMVRLSTVEIRDKYASRKLERVGFDERKKTSGLPPSRFITRSDIEKRNPMSLTHMLERQGGRVRSCVDAIVYVDGTPPGPVSERVTDVRPRFSRNAMQRRTQSEGTNANEFRILEAIPPRHIEGMEVYTSIAEIPIEFRPGGNSSVIGRCVILLWTRDR